MHECSTHSLALVESVDPEVPLADGLGCAFLGIGRQYNLEIAVYSERLAIKHFAEEFEDECDAEWHDECDHFAEANEWFEFNVVEYVGEQTPIFVDRGEDEPDATYWPLTKPVEGAALISAEAAYHIEAYLRQSPSASFEAYLR